VSFLAYVVTFHSIWIAWPYVIYPRLAAIGDATLAYAAINIGLRLLVWVVPVCWYLRYVDGVEPLGYLKLTDHVRRGLWVAVVVTVLNLLGSIARFGTPQFSLDRLTWNSGFGTSLLVGVIEEIPYRGFMLQKFSERVGFPLATLVTAVLFLGVHLPGWTALHMLRPELAAFVFIFSVVMALIFKYSNSLWAPILAHSANDFISVVLFRR